VYAVTCRCRKVGRTSKFESWAYPLVNGEPLANLPIWLSVELNVPLELEARYEESCQERSNGSSKIAAALWTF
jgi:hypothetical protein